MTRVFNFCAGPAALPEAVLKQARDELLDWHGCGLSVMEMSHRGKDMVGIAERAEADLCELLGIGDDYAVLFLQGGATAQFAAIPMNLLGGATTADYVDTGQWSQKAIAEAREHGDLKENAEYHAAREQQGFVEARINDIESKLAGAQIIDVTKIPETGRVIFGATVAILNLETNDTLRYRIVGEDEASVRDNKISVTSPLARSLIGKEIGDVVMVRTPGGDTEYEIVATQHI
ncbi:MAG: transcription elongation factor GreA [Pseudomonadales bacterium]|nr:transcription elongation factor GreA [Pseudomonadales bacterium]